MELEIEIKSIDLDVLLDDIIGSLEEGMKSKALKRGKDELKDNKKCLIGVLKDMNGNISQEEKLLLMKMVLDWANRNGVLQNAIQSLIKNNEDIRNTLEPLKIEIGDITLDGDLEIKGLK